MCADGSPDSNRGQGEPTANLSRSGHTSAGTLRPWKPCEKFSAGREKATTTSIIITIIISMSGGIEWVHTSDKS